ncbi:MAG TPA: purine-nucleoside phosphorylase [Acidimicrobiales bacterium]|nr:purine-nucleoside phosphorylase [Acidimicrobiales bacterium]
MTNMHPIETARVAAAELVSRLGVSPDVAVVLGSGWGQAAEGAGDELGRWPMSSFTGFPSPSVPGHEGSVRATRLGQRTILWLAGRSHVYEGRTSAEITHAARAAVLAGAPTVVLTNAAGAINPLLPVGRPVLVRDHLNLTRQSPLSGPEPPAGFPSRFVDLSDLYSARLRNIAHEVAPELAEGVYAAMPRPHYETPAEISMLRNLGADLVGMSTALEAIASRHLGAAVLALSLVTNLAAGVGANTLDHGEVIAAGRAAVPVLHDLFVRLLPSLAG